MVYICILLIKNVTTIRGVHWFGSVETESNLANQSYNSVLKIEPNRTELVRFKRFGFFDLMVRFGLFFKTEL